MAESSKKSAATIAKEAKAEAAQARKEAVAAKRELAREKALQVGAASKGHVAGFMGFVREQGVVGLAVGLAIGTQAGATVKAIVEGFITPIVAFLVGSTEGLTKQVWNVVGQDTETVNYWFTMGQRQLVFSWGQVLSSLITLLAVAAVIYYVVKGLKLDKLDKKKA